MARSDPQPDPRPIYLVATAGYPNFGDEFITAAWLRHLAWARPDSEVWLDSPNPGLTPHLFGGIHPGLRHTDTLWRLLAEHRHLPLDELDALVDGRVAHLGTPRFDLGLMAARQAGTVHLLGGGHMNSLWAGQDRLLRAARGLKEASGAGLHATGLGLMPIGDESWLRGEVEAFDHFSTRDRSSAAGSGGLLAPDDAFLAVDLPARIEPSDEVWVTIQSDVGSPERVDAAIEAVRTALTTTYAGRPVRYLEAIPGVDRIAYDRLADVMPEGSFVPFVHLWRHGFPARPGQTWLTTRFHFHLLAAAAGAEGTALIVHDDYYGVKHQSLLDIGTGWSVTPPGSTTVAPPAVNPDFPAIAADLHRAKLDEADLIYPVSKRQCRRRGR